MNEHSKLLKKAIHNNYIEKEVTIHHCPEVWCSFELEIEYSICSAFGSAFVAFIVFIHRNTVGRV